jgi:Flp pilus assembly protein TadG
MTWPQRGLPPFGQAESFLENIMLIKKFNSRRRRSGVVTVEMALCLPLLLTFILFMFEFSRVYMLRQSVTEAAYQAARAIKVPGGASSEADSVVQTMMEAVGAQNYTIQVQPQTVLASTDYVTVTVTVPINGNSWGAPLFSNNSQIIGSSTLKTERFRRSN